MEVMNVPVANYSCLFHRLKHPPCLLAIPILDALLLSELVSKQPSLL